MELHNEFIPRNFASKEGLISFGEYLRDGGELKVGLAVILEKNLRTHINAILLDWKEVQKEYNNMTLCRLADNTASLLLENGDMLNDWSFSMIYIKK